MDGLCAPGVGGGGPVAGVRVGWGWRKLSMHSRDRLLRLAPSLEVVVGSPDVKLGVQVFAMFARETVTEVHFSHLNHPGPIHVPQGPVKLGHWDLKLLETQHKPRSYVLLAPIAGI